MGLMRRSVSLPLLITLILLIIAATFGSHYFFIRTLKFSELTGPSDIPAINTIVNFFDFDTGLTKYDILRLKSKIANWETRINQVNSLQDPKQRQFENEKLLSDMMQDPVMKKILKKFLALGWEVTRTLAVLKMLL